MKIKSILLISILSLLLVFAGCSSNGSSDGVTIGYMGPLTGDAAVYGESIQKSAQLALDELALDAVNFVAEDSKCEGKESATVIKKLISVDGAAAVIGEACSTATLAAAPIAQENGVVLVSAASTSPALSDAGDYFFRTVPSDLGQGSFGAKLAYERGARKLAVLYGNEDYGLGFNEVLNTEFPALGGDVVASEAFEAKSVDVRSQVTKIKAANPDAVYIISNSPDSAVAALKQIAEQGLDVMIFASEGLKSQPVLDGAGDAAQGMVVTSVSTGNPAFVEKYEAAYGEAPGPFAAQGYDAMLVLGTAIKNGATTSEEIAVALREMNLEGASGTISFDENGDVGGNYEVYVATDGAFVVEE